MKPDFACKISIEFMKHYQDDLGKKTEGTQTNKTINESGEYYCQIFRNK